MSFAAGKIAWLLLKPSNLLALLFALGLVLRLFRRRRLGFVLMAFAVLVAAAAALLPLGARLLAPLENRFPESALPARVDGIIVLGGAIEPAISADRGRVTLNESADRLVAFVELGRRYPDAKLVFTGGSGTLATPEHREADWVGRFLDSVGFPRARVILERESRNTHENVVLTKAAVQPAPGETWVLVTSARHMPRSVGLFRKAGWPVIAHPVDYLTPRQVEIGIGFNVAHGLMALDLAAYEWVGLAFYKISGRIDDWLPGP